MVYWILPNLGTYSMFESYTEEGVVIIDVRDIKDGEGNSVEAVAKKIELISNLMCSGYVCVLRCQAGMSRSNTLACAALMWCRIFDNWGDAWKHVQNCCPRAVLNMDLFDTVKKTLLYNLKINLTEDQFIP
jgi:protein-tyrosine phosphatase